jgi:hypothetical protein
VHWPVGASYDYSGGSLTIGRPFINESSYGSIAMSNLSNY